MGGPRHLSTDSENVFTDNSHSLHGPWLWPLCPRRWLPSLDLGPQGSASVPSKGRTEDQRDGCGRCVHGASWKGVAWPGVARKKEVTGQEALVLLPHPQG